VRNVKFQIYEWQRATGSGAFTAHLKRATDSGGFPYFYLFALLPCCLVALLPCCIVALLQPCCLIALLSCCLVAALLPCCCWQWRVSLFLPNAPLAVASSSSYIQLGPLNQKVSLINVGFRRTDPTRLKIIIHSLIYLYVFKYNIFCFKLLNDCPKYHISFVTRKNEKASLEYST
jgi:hypothetical protein